MKMTSKHLLGLTIAFFIGTGFWAGNQIVSSQSERDNSDSFPIVSFEPESYRQQSVSENRARRNSKFDGWAWVRKSPNPDVQEVFLNTHWQVGLSPLPTSKSDLIVFAQVKSSNAFLSNDLTGVYSEFELAIERIFKANRAQPVETDVIVSVVRPGARVKYPSGRIIKYSLRGQEMPIIGAKYVLFLTFDQDLRIYSILTGFEIRSDDQIKALDGRNGDERAGWSFVSKNSLTREQFFQELELSVLAEGEELKEKSLQ